MISDEPITPQGEKRMVLLLLQNCIKSPPNALHLRCHNRLGDLSCDSLNISLRIQIADAPRRRRELEHPL